MLISRIGFPEIIVRAAIFATAEVLPPPGGPMSMIGHGCLPSSGKLQALVTPICETLAGWKSSTEGVRSLEQLPDEALRYVKRIEELISAPVTILSTGPDRKDTIVIRDPFSATTK